MASFIDSLSFSQAIFIEYLLLGSLLHAARYGAAGLRDALTRKTCCDIESEESKGYNKEQRGDVQ